MSRRDAYAAVAATLAAVLLAGTAAGATAGTPGGVAVAEKYAELTNHWAAAWGLLTPTQQKFIPRTLYVSCMKRIQTNRPKAIRIIGRRASTIVVPAPSPKRVSGWVVRLHIDYGSAAPSQDAVLKVVASGSSWRWVSSAGSRQAFVRQNFCR